MIDRESTFADPQIIEMLQGAFIPVAIDQWYQRGQDDPEGQFYQRLATQGPRRDMNETTQGFYIATAAGELLHYNNNRGPERIKSLMKGVIARSRSWSADPIGESPGVAADTVQPTPGTVVVQVNSKVLAGYPTGSASAYQTILQNAVGRDNLWIYPAELAALEAGQFPRTLAEKIARFHAVDNTRGEPPMWRESEIQQLQIRLRENGVVQGRLKLATADQHRQYQADLRGRLEFSDGQLRRFDLVIHGFFQGEGPYTKGAPAGKFPLAVAFRIGDSSDPAGQVLPQAIKAFGRGYLRMGIH